LNGCVGYPSLGAAEKWLHTVDSVTLSRPLYAIWLQNSDKQAQIREILKSRYWNKVYSMDGVLRKRENGNYRKKSFA
jgi:hypothetical protein